MALYVYSQRLFAETIGGDGYDYTAITGYQTVMRDLTVCGNTDALPVQVAVSLTSPSDCTLLELAISTEALAPFTAWSGRIVLDPGDVIHIAATALCDVQCSGYQLVLP
jgi:hypothetical protein